ncbi:hypothetical protein NERG_01078 [Nematocida ausubeli]|uniref:Uncharacterized protein n=1 Tax=Nematocida ausubeli (strain ATCC PRA-371 / ERTm2) TaxID=1913371 RepID=H8ZCT1_NEMA1|nr:hypothetical protein NERG_01078 [Nematocida ausubeli]
MPLDAFSEIKQAEKSHTKNEQKEHLAAVKETLGHFLKKESKIPNLHDMYSKIEEIEKEQEKAKDLVRISPEIIEKIKAFSELPAVKRTAEARQSTQKYCRTLFDYTE